MSEAVIALGSNMGNRIENINAAIRAIAKLPDVKIIKASSVYETEPVGCEEDDMYLNAAILVDVNISPAMLLGECLGIEAAMGRIRTKKNAPRIIDLDLILYDGVKTESFELTLPHPRVLERAFVMAPLLDLYPSGRAPGMFFAPHLRDIGTDGIRKTEKEIIIPIY
ncbi:MAG: 2-amino-4-hydroxy-6-hydroxymethyldihydropteridine diphosphokinase [Clostridia bacterium]|nr:2-amino-4-hydroxy-6-hydroxymethyldihydropteridine diphosphokinase [Clostridia bacterium]MBR3818845.1 2-amino-4-hydroxy-6-hydroxymethyldihydropteridine diphosphokinase [Clostridia bacterium]